MELVGGERGRRIEADWHELIRGHDRDRTGLARPSALEFFSAACRTDARYSAGPLTNRGKSARAFEWVEVHTSSVA
jgi:hypothetical protein